MGTGALTTRGMYEKEMTRVADLCIEAIKISKRIQGAVGKKLVDFEKALKTDEEVAKIREEVITFARGFGIPGL